MANNLQTFSDELAAAVETVGSSVVRIDDGTRLTASGVVWSHDGLIVATSHGVESDEVQVVFHDGKSLPARVLGRDHDSDIAVLRAEGAGLPEIKKATGKARVGSIVLAVGSPGNGGLRATIGIVSASRESAGGGSILFTDALMVPGFSGSALANASGELVGLNNLQAARGRGAALAVDWVGEVVRQIVDGGSVKRAYLGVRTQGVEFPASAQPEGQASGLLIAGVEEGSPAANSGLLIGDILLGIGESRLEEIDDLRRALRGARPGDQITIQLVRGGQIHELQATLGVQEEA